MEKTLRLTLLISLMMVLVGCTDTSPPELTAMDSTPTPAERSLTVVTADDVQRMSVAEGRELLAREMALFYDTRTLEEYRALHIEGAFPFPETEMSARVDELPTDETLVFY